MEFLLNIDCAYKSNNNRRDNNDNDNANSNNHNKFQLLGTRRKR